MENKIFNAWLKSSSIDKKTKDLMKEMSHEEVGIAFNSNPIKFGTAGYRAKVGPGNHYLNEKTYYQLAIGYAKFIRYKFPKKSAPKVLVVHDNRYNGGFFTEIVCTALEEYGIKPVINKNNDLLPTPIASYLIKEMKLQGGINITASHNPKEYNGFKCYDQTGSQLLPDDADKIIEFLPTWEDALNKNIKVNFTPKYISELEIKRYFIDVFKSLPNTKVNKKYLKLVYSSMHGTASYYMSNFLNKLGYICIDVPTQNYPDPNFTHAPICNPEDECSLDAAIILADTLNVNIVLASDPDADRLAIAIKKDDEWVFLNGNQAGIIETYYKLQKFKHTKKTPVVISTYISTNLIDRIIKPFNGKIIRTPTGFKWVGDQINKLKKNEFYINGFEEAIGALPSTINRDKDSFQTAALILEIINSYNAKFMNLIDILEKEIYPTYGHWYGSTTSLIIKGTNWKNKALNMLDVLKNNDLTKIGDRKIKSKIFNVDADAMEYHFENDSWVKFRISGTEPKFKIYTNLYALNDNHKYDLSFTQKLQEESNKIVEFIKEYLKI